MWSPRPEPGAADYAALELRVAALEEQQAHVFPQDLAATRVAVGLLHRDVTAMRGELGRHGQHLDQVAAEVSTVARSQIEHGGALAGLGGKVDGLEGKVDGLQGKVDGLEGKVDGLEIKFDGLQGKVDGVESKVDGLVGKVDSNSEMLAEILRRLPGAGQ
jgi:hypothetical protein